MSKRIRHISAVAWRNWAGACVLAWSVLIVAGCSSRPAAEIRLTKNAADEVESMLFLGRNVTDADLRKVSEYPGLKELAIQECAQVTDAGFAALGGASQLTKLSVIRANISDEGLASIASLTGLSDIELSHTKVKGDGLKHFANMPLKRLVLTSREVTVEGLASLKLLGELRELDLDCKEIKLSDLGGLSELKQLESLSALPMPAGNSLEMLRGLPLAQLNLNCEEIGDESIEVLNTLTQLQELRLSSSQITDEGLKGLALPQLTKLTISNCVKITDAGLANLQGMPLLQDLLVGGSGINGRDFTPLAPMKHLKSILMDGEQFKGNDASIEALKALLPNCEVVILRG